MAFRAAIVVTNAAAKARRGIDVQWMDDAFKRIEHLRKLIESTESLSIGSISTPISQIQEQYIEIINRLKDVINHYEESASCYTKLWHVFKVGGICLAALASLVGIWAAAAHLPQCKTLLTIISAMLTVCVGAFSGVEATLRLRDRQTGSNELRDLFFRLFSFASVTWKIAGIEAADNEKTRLEASAILLYIVEEENQLRQKYNIDLQQQMPPSPGGVLATNV